MTRDDIKKIFGEATDEQVSAVLDIHSRDIGKAKSGGEKLQSELDKLKSELETARGTITELEANKADAGKLQAQLDAYREAEEQRKAAEKAAAEKAELDRKSVV